MAKLSFDERVDRDVNCIANRKIGGIAYRNGCINKLNDRTKTYEIWFAEREVEITCKALCNSGFCNNQDCESCPITAALNNAKDEIERGFRPRPQYTRNCHERKTSVTITKSGKIIITQTI